MSVGGTLTREREAELREAVAERLGESKFGLWFGEGVRLGIDGDTLAVGVPNTFFRDWIKGHFADNLADAAKAVAGRPLRLSFLVGDEADANPRVGQVVPDVAPDVRAPAPVPIPQAPPAERPRPQGRPGRRLEDFVVGPGNRLAHAAAIEAVRGSGATFNPLVIHGGVGLGKSHLLEGIAAATRAAGPGRKVVQTTAEAFTNGFLDAMRNGNLAAFRAKHRQADVLILDDIHFLARARATQDEFLHTFDALVAAGATVVVSCDQHPRLIHKLSDEIVTRLLGGMVVKLEGPDPATRRAILKAKAAARGVDVPEAVVAYVAEHLRASVRELEGALNSLVAHALLAGKRLDLNLAKTALRDTIRHTAQAVALRDVERAACEVFGIDAELLKSSSRARAVAYPRMVAMYLARKHTGAAFSEIGRYFGGRNHSTVIAADKKVASWLRDAARAPMLAGFESVADLLAALERSLGT